MQQALSAIAVSVITAVSSIMPNATAAKTATDHTAQVVNTTRLETRARTNDLLESARQKREEITNRIEERKQEVKDKIASKAAEFKVRVAEIKDERKQKVLEKISSRLTTLNQKWVDHWNATLTRLTEILAKIESRGNNLAGEGKDISALTASIAAAKVNIANAQGAVDAQAVKTYTIDITSEDNLGQDAKFAISQFHADVKSVWELVKIARKSVVDSLVQLGRLSGETVEENEDGTVEVIATPSPEATVVPTAAPTVEPTAVPTVEPTVAPI